MVQNAKQLVRLAVIEIDTSQIKLYNEFLREEIEASVRLEPGVITLYGVAEKESPQHVILFETYADSSLYRSHIATPHFQKYKQGTLSIVKHLKLIEMQPLLYHRKASLAKAEKNKLYSRLIKMQIDPGGITRFKELADSVMLSGIKRESGVLVMYAVLEKNDPTRITILEVYQDLHAYNKHINTRYFLKYKEASLKVVKSLSIFDVDPILLGSKPQ